MGWNPLKKSSWKELGDKVLGTGDKIEDVFDEVIEDAKKQIIAVKDDVRENVHKQWKAVEKHIEEQTSEAQGIVHKKLQDAQKEVRITTRKAGEELEKVGKEIEKGLKKGFNAGVPDILLKTALPTSISISGQVVGNGITISYEESEEAVDEVMKAIREGKFDVDIMYHVIPDSITIEVGVELALVVSVDVGASITYNSQEDIRMIVEWLKQNT